MVKKKRNKNEKLKDKDKRKLAARAKQKIEAQPKRWNDKYCLWLVSNVVLPLIVGYYPWVGGNSFSIRIILIMRRSICFLNVGEIKLTVLIIATIWLCMISSSFLVAGERIIVDGKVSSNKDQNSNVIAVSVITNSGEEFRITLNEKGKKLNRKL